LDCALSSILYGIFGNENKGKKGLVLRIEDLDYNCEIGSWTIRYFRLGTTGCIEKFNALVIVLFFYKIIIYFVVIMS